MRLLMMTIVAISFLSWSATNCDAALWLYLSAGGDSYTIQDNGALDADPTVDSISPVMSLTNVGDFSLDPTLSGVSFGGGLVDAHVDVHLNITYLPGSSSFPGNEFVVRASSTDVPLSNGLTGLRGEIGGTSSPAIGPTNIAFLVAYDPANQLFSFPVATTLVPVTVGGDVYSAFIQSSFAGGNLFSLSYEATITADAVGQNVVFDSGPIALTNSVPEPASLGLWAAAAGLSLGFARWRSQRSSRR